MAGRSGASPTSPAGGIVVGVDGEVLMKKAEGAELLVVGSRGYGRIFGALLGSVSQYVAARAPRPVVVIRTATTRTSRDLGPDADGNAP